MVESYFEYVLAKCSDQVIPSVCSMYKTKAELLVAAQNGFNGSDYILGQGLLIYAAIDFTADGGYINDNGFSFDGEKVYLRCTKSLAEMKQENLRHIDIDRERIAFDAEYALYHSKEEYLERAKTVQKLISSPEAIPADGKIYL